MSERELSSRSEQKTKPDMAIASALTRAQLADEGYDEGCEDAESEASERIDRVREDGERRERYAREESERNTRSQIERRLESEIEHDTSKDYFERRREIERVRSAVR